MKVVFDITIELRHERGKFSTRESLTEELREALEQADPGNVSGDGDEAEYAVDSWDVQEGTP